MNNCHGNQGLKIQNNTLLDFQKRADDSWNWHIGNKMQYALSIITLWMDRFPTGIFQNKYRDFCLSFTDEFICSSLHWANRMA